MEVFLVFWSGSCKTGNSWLVEEMGVIDYTPEIQEFCKNRFVNGEFSGDGWFKRYNKEA